VGQYAPSEPRQVGQSLTNFGPANKTKQNIAFVRDKYLSTIPFFLMLVGTTNNAQSSSSTIVAACAALAVTMASAALQRQQQQQAAAANRTTCAAANVQLEDEEDDLTLSENPIGQSIWRETSKDPLMSIETQGSMDSATESLDDYSPTATDLDGNFHANTIFDKLPIDDNDNTSTGLSGSFRIMDILMIATWIAFVATAQTMNGGGAVPSPTTVTTTTTTPPVLIEMTPRHFTEGLTKPASSRSDDGSGDIDGVVPAAPAPSVSAVLIDTPIFIPTSSYFDAAPPQQCWIVDTRIEPISGLYGMMIGVNSQAELSRLHHQPVSDLAGVYGALVVDAPFEMQLKSDAMDRLVSSVHQSDFIQSSVDVPDNGMYGSYVGAERIATLGAPVLEKARANVAAWRARTVEHVDTAVYGPYLGANINLPPQRVALESFAELHAAWSLHTACQLY
jgi:hypothetical protein